MLKHQRLSKAAPEIWLQFFCFVEEIKLFFSQFQAKVAFLGKSVYNKENLENCRKKVQNRTNTVKLCFERKSLCQSAGY